MTHGLRARRDLLELRQRGRGRGSLSMCGVLKLVSKRVRLGHRFEFLERVVLDLPDALSGEVERRADLVGPTNSSAAPGREGFQNLGSRSGSGRRFALEASADAVGFQNLRSACKFAFSHGQLNTRRGFADARRSPRRGGSGWRRPSRPRREVDLYGAGVRFVPVTRTFLTVRASWTVLPLSCASRFHGAPIRIQRRCATKRTGWPGRSVPM
jgi:hypothetical protein